MSASFSVPQGTKYPMVFHRGMAPSLQNWRGMGNGGLPILDRGMGNGKSGMANENGKWVLSLCEYTIANRE